MKPCPVPPPHEHRAAPAPTEAERSLLYADLLGGRRGMTPAVQEDRTTKMGWITRGK
jgi:hypothetical protein